jgi:hypothetical protein
LWHTRYLLFYCTSIFSLLFFQVKCNIAESKSELWIAVSLKGLERNYSVILTVGLLWHNMNQHMFKLHSVKQFQRLIMS